MSRQTGNKPLPKLVMTQVGDAYVSPDLKGLIIAG